MAKLVNHILGWSCQSQRVCDSQYERQDNNNALHASLLGDPEVALVVDMGLLPSLTRDESSSYHPHNTDMGFCTHGHVLPVTRHEALHYGARGGTRAHNYPEGAALARCD